MTHKQRVLQLLSDHKPHSHHELYQLGCVAHSRISDLRKDGHLIEQWRDGDLYLYRLLNEAPGSPAPGASLSTPASNPASLDAAAIHDGRDGAGVLSSATVAQSVERDVANVEVAGSRPAGRSGPHRPEARTAPCRGADRGSIPRAGADGILSLFGDAA